MALTRISIRERLLRFFYFFPFQLMILHIKKNHLLLFSWIIIFAYLSGNLATKYGVSILFLYPEYLGENNYIAFAILGFSAGGFIMAFNLYSYIMHGFRFPFIASLSRPFLKFSINNFIIPLLFVIYYCYYSADYQLNKELIPGDKVFFNLLGFIGGLFLFCLISFAYFLSTNKDVFRFVKARKGLSEGFGLIKDKKSLKKENQRWQNLRQNRRTWRVETYLKSFLKVGLARDSIHYNNEIIAKILAQNHINASIFEIIVIISFLVIGSLREYALFMIPAAASLFLLFTMLLMIISALYSWFKGWTISVIILLVLIINSASSETNILNKESRGFGLNYDSRTPYNEYVRSGFPDEEKREQDRAITLEMLNNWKDKIRKKYGKRKPKMILLNSSGGGMRSALWNFKLLNYLDSVTQGAFYDHVVLITGSSGGMLGQSYFREIKLRTQQGHDIQAPLNYYPKLGKDILNPIAFSLVTNDLFIRYQRIKDNDFSYVKDRGYAFEKAFNENTNYFLDKRMGDYTMPERKAEIPMMIITPSIVNDARKLLIASNPVGYLTTNPDEESRPLLENIEMAHLLAASQPLDLKFTSALRMSSTFPYILPSVTLPTYPGIDVIDAGLRDNYGLTTSIAFASEFEDWIARNTSGVIFLQMRDLQKVASVNKNINSTFLKKLISPLETVYGNIFNVHNFNQDQIWKQFTSGSKIKAETVIITLQRSRKDKISLSWHLSQKEKQYITQSLQEPGNYPEIENLLNKLSNGR
ncbi:patatin-like phospholipase domain-containing protein [Luteibaculum oceani]|uniref:Patatin-like phospholipase family protein n=1 Tax=Luteibaculum oceani TaxID=1294296 RepID=A0A5C6V9I0_9FLAO|nr:patatin-like phospholipase family protein [Luteibaculum oceani]TXC81354.1 patatin-like phospholipase family protein [Luteibaculum oceani]